MSEWTREKRINGCDRERGDWLEPLTTRTESSLWQEGGGGWLTLLGVALEIKRGPSSNVLSHFVSRRSLLPSSRISSEAEDEKVEQWVSSCGD